MQEPLISIIIPIYNTAKYLDTCIASVVGQTYQNLEILLIDDGSTDACPAICEDWVQKDQRIKVIHQRNAGAAAAKNTGLDQMRGDFFSIVDSDDLLVPDILESQYNVLRSQNADIVESDLFRFYQDSETITIDLSRENVQSEMFTAQEALQELMLGHKLHQTPVCKLYAASTTKNVRFVPGTYIDDEFWTYKVFGNANRVVRFGTVGYFYRQHPESAMGKPYSLKRLIVLDALEERWYYMKDRYPALESLAWQTYAGECMYHFQKLCQLPELDLQKEARRHILSRLKQGDYKSKCRALPCKKKLLFRFFFVAPFLFSSLRNAMRKGI